MNHPKVSVIIPIYNGEKYLRRCLDSILCQSFTDFELLLINDGSKDSSGAICDEYASRDNRIRVFHKENGGVSSARNLGLDNAKGEWISFVDADDWVDFRLYQTCISKSLESDYELITFDIEIIEKTKTYQTCSWEYRPWKSYYDANKKQWLDLLNQSISWSWGVVWNFIVKKEFLRDNKLGFDLDITYSEDTVFFAKIISKKPNLFHINQSLYTYNRANVESITNNLSEKNFTDRIQAFVNLSKYLIDNHLFEATQEALSIKFTDVCIPLTKHFSMYPQIIEAMSPHYNSKIFQYDGSHLSAKIRLWLITHGCSGLARFMVKFAKH